jgi:serine/threonine protein phosphatase 1
MRVLAIGDIHGCLRSFDTLLDAVSPQPEDQLITLGDYIDRGPDSRGVLDRLLALYAGGQLVPLRGNHDVMMLDARCGRDLDWLLVGGKQTLRSYGVPDAKIAALQQGVGWFGDPEEVLEAIPERHWEFLEQTCLPYYETDKHIFVHANLYPDLPLQDQPDYMLYWERLDEACAHVSGKTMICGHTRQKNGLPRDLETTVCIDTNVYDGGWLTCLDVLSGRVWQANERGQLRTGSLDSMSDAS